MYSALDALRDSGIKIASDGAEYKKIAEFGPTDATTNPSLVYAAVCNSGSQYSHLLDKAVEYSVKELGAKDVEAKVGIALDYLLVLVGAQISTLIPGRISLSIDPRLFLPTTISPLDTTAFTHVLSRCISLYDLTSRLYGASSASRLLLKIPATPLGIHVAATLESKYGIHTNLTLVFGLVQAVACAQAGVSVISPFIGRVKDFYESRGQRVPKNAAGEFDLSHHPGIQLVRRIKEVFRFEGYEGKTEIMAAGFRSAEEIIELGRLGKHGGPDFVTLPPDLLHDLRERESRGWEDLTSSPPTVLSTPVSTYFTSPVPTIDSLAKFDADIREEEIALEKVPEGLRKFAADTDKLEVALRDAIILAIRKSPVENICSSLGKVATTTGDEVARGRRVMVNRFIVAHDLRVLL